MTAFHTHEAALKMLKEELGFHMLGVLQGAPGAYQERPVQWDDERVHVLLHPSEPMIRLDQGSVSCSLSNHRSSIPPLTSRPLHHRPFATRTCLVVGKHTRGLPISLAQLCDGFVHIPHHGIHFSRDDTVGWLTTEAGVSIVLHEFAMWAGYAQASSSSGTGKIVHYQGQKYQVDTKPRDDAEEQIRKQEERKAKREGAVSTDEEFAMTAFGRNDEGDY